MTRFPIPLFLGIFAVPACTPGEVVTPQGDCNECDDVDNGDDDTGTPPGDDDTSEPEGDEWSDYVEASGSVISFSDDGFSSDLYQADAYMVGYGESIGYNLAHRASNTSGRFSFDTSGWTEDCYDSSLISSLSVTNEGGGDYSYEEISSWDETGDWWDNHQFCESGSASAATWCHYEGGENYFVSFCVTSSGVVPNGDGI